MPVQSGLKKSVPIETGVLVEGGKEVVCQQLVSALNPGRVGRRAFLSFAAFQLDFAAQARARRGHPWVAYRKSPSNNVEDYVSQSLFASQAIDIALILTDPH